MARTFSLTSNAYSGRTLTLSCSQSQNIANNTSTISWTLTSAGGSSDYYSTGPTNAYINGSNVYYKARTNWNTYAFPAARGSVSGTITVSHNADGTCAIPVSLSTAIYTSTVSSKSGTWTLDSIPRGATITNAPNFNDEQNPTISYNNPAGTSVTTLQACISFTGSTDDIVYRDIPKTGTSYTFNLTTAERNLLRTSTANANSRTIYFYIKTIISGNTFLNNVSKTLSIVNATPTLSSTVVDNNATTVALTGDNNKLIKGYSNASYSIGAVALKGATITSQRVVSNGVTNTANTGVYNATESNVFVFTAVDSRNNSATNTVTKTLIDYIKLTNNISAKIGVNGTATITTNGNYFNASFGTTANTLTVEYRYKEYGGSYSAWTSIARTLNGNTYSGTATINGLDYQKAYVFQTRAVDKLNTIPSREVTVKSQPVFDWGENDFKVNVELRDKLNTEIVNGLAKYRTGGVDIDPNTTLEELILTETNRPGTWGFWYVRTIFYGGKTTTTNRTQIAYPYAYSTNIKANTYIRTYVNGIGWSAWAQTGTRSESGWVIITPSAANVPTAVRVNFKNTYVKAPNVVTNVGSGVVGTQVLGTSTNGITTTYANIVLTRTNTVATTVYYTVMEGD